ncbi:acetyltransferase [Mesorhizobium salmacidum]|uniref:Acetyltransferase n=1 Tax=Mesorhizobium salmacidum TaxID=3015171 RepID=A0ABU8L776_9HYPH
MNSGAVIYGAGGHARELQFQLHAEGTATYAYVDDFRSGFDVEGTPVLVREDAIARFPGASWFVAIGDIASRKAILARVRELGVTVGSFISSRAMIAPSASISGAAQIFANTVVSAGAALGDNVIVNFGSILHHDASIGANSFIASGVTVAGHAKIGSGVWLGVGCTIINGTADNPLKIGNNVIVGASACVVNDVDDDAIVVGVPAKPRSF